MGQFYTWSELLSSQKYSGIDFRWLHVYSASIKIYVYKKTKLQLNNFGPNGRQHGKKLSSECAKLSKTFQSQKVIHWTQRMNKKILSLRKS